MFKKRSIKNALYKIATLTALATSYSSISAEEGTDPLRSLPARTLPVPTTVSLEMQRAIAQPLHPNARFTPKSSEQWRDILQRASRFKPKALQQARKLFDVDVSPQIISGVPVFIVTPKLNPEQNHDLVIIHLHGGNYVFLGGERALPEAMALAYYGNYKVISVDYRLPPDAPFPAALEDAVTVYQEVIKKTAPAKVAFAGSAAGGGLTMAVLHKLKELNLPFPKVIGLGSPWTDLTKTGDSYYTNEDIDNVLVSYNGMVGASARLYGGSNDLKIPYLSPIYGQFNSDFPPTILITGTRDLFLSNTVRLFRKLRQVGVEAELQVFEGMSHAFHIDNLDAPESTEAFHEIVRFFQKHFRE